ncbi:putative MFS toxin efflux pump [Talaromyces proteolyticus]|uniref:MFS toxin efflux pump n=1 Tax=Talaromyces proteolyticus TaxID=1131652 RepID=A0AAD4KJX2_9EURO|nr:putative MFS toxin efflux pump [Talaromyces proteolyticus]KAH8692966.1 putative MFS toxin efflux pump [Talaromyces proteolyticus]
MEEHKSHQVSAPTSPRTPFAASRKPILTKESETRLVPLEIDDASASGEHNDQQQPVGLAEGYPSAWRVAAIMVGMSLACTLVALDNTILATAIPRITTQFDSLEDVGWYGSAFLLTNCSVSLLYGKLYTFFPVKWVYMCALAVFEAGSLLCGATPSSVGLIIGRAIAGAGGGGLFSGAMLIIAESAPLHQRPVYNGIIMAIFTVAGVAGPLLGGALTDNTTWRWCFYINLPLGGVTGFVILFFLKSKKPVKTTEGAKEYLWQLDPVGLLFFLPSMICLLLALQWGGSKYPWQDARIIALFAVFSALFLTFVVVQIYEQDRATIPPRLFKNRNIWGASLYTFCLSASFMVFTYYLPIWFQSVKSASATMSGVLNLPMLGTLGTFTILSGILVTYTGHYMPFILTAPVLTSIAAGLLTTLTPSSSQKSYVGYQALYGVGCGLGMTQPMLAVQACVESPADAPSATVIVIFMQTLGGALFVSAAQNMFHNKLLHLLRSVEGVDVKKVVEAGAAGLKDVADGDVLDVVVQSYSSAITYSFFAATALAAAAMLGALPMQWISLKRKGVDKKDEGVSQVAS